MRVTVLGAGVVGVATAYYLSQKGHSVTVVDRAEAVASGASGGNGGQLSYSFTDAMASPALLSKMPGIMTGGNPAFHVRPTPNLQLIRWGLSFLRQCTHGKHRQNTLAVLKMALRSGELVRELQDSAELEFNYRRSGKLVMLDSPKAVEEARDMCALKQQLGCDAEVVDIARAIDIEPALKGMDNGYLAAVYSHGDEVGNSQAFTRQLAQWLCDRRGVEFQLGNNIRRVVAAGGVLKAVETDRGALTPDAVVVCMGAWSSQLLRPLGIRVNIYPMRGYSVTLPAIGTSNNTSITDPGTKTVFSRLGDDIRIAGFADFVGYRTDRDDKRTTTLLETARRTAPDIADFDVQDAGEWGGFRPMTPDSRPLIGPTGIRGIHLNTGHGMLGWTLACASGHQVAEGI